MNQNCSNEFDPLKKIATGEGQFLTMYIKGELEKFLSKTIGLRADLKIMWHKWSVGDHLPRLFKLY